LLLCRFFLKCLLDFANFVRLVDEDIHTVAIQLPACELAQFGESFFVAPGRLVNAAGSQCVEDIRNRNDPGFKRDGRAFQSARIAAAVDILVVIFGNVADHV
jgi:hypothetical protein